jgi:hypothetical protein
LRASSRSIRAPTARPPPPAPEGDTALAEGGDAAVVGAGGDALELAVVATGKRATLLPLGTALAEDGGDIHAWGTDDDDDDGGGGGFGCDEGIA